MFALSDTMGERLAKLFEEKSGFTFDCLFHFFSKDHGERLIK